MTDDEAKEMFLKMSTEAKIEYLYRENERRFKEMKNLTAVLSRGSA